MKRGTTPTHTFTVPVEMKKISKIKVIYAQNDEQLFCRRENECTIVGDTISVTLTQEETLKFNSKYYGQVQVRIVTDDGDALVSDEITFPVGKLLDDEVIV